MLLILFGVEVQGDRRIKGVTLAEVSPSLEDQLPDHLFAIIHGSLGLGDSDV